MSFSSVAIHLSVLPYADLTLLSSNSIVGIVVATILSISFLGERWVLRYDLTALILIIIGCTTIVMLSNKADPNFDAGDIQDLLFSVRTIVYLAVCCLIVVIDYIILNYMLKGLKMFEVDAHNYDQKMRDQAKRQNIQLSESAFVLPTEEDDD